MAHWPDREIALTRPRTFGRDWLLRTTPGDAKLPVLLVGLTMNCPRRRAASIYERCKARLATVRDGL